MALPLLAILPAASAALKLSRDLYEMIRNDPDTPAEVKEKTDATLRKIEEAEERVADLPILS
jgi:hypothetical protein